jgi:hypothetical protein
MRNKPIDILSILEKLGISKGGNVEEAAKITSMLAAAFDAGARWVFTFEDGPQPFTYWAVAERGRVVAADYAHDNWCTIVVQKPEAAEVGKHLPFVFEPGAPVLNLKAAISRIIDLNSTDL